MKRSRKFTVLDLHDENKKYPLLGVILVGGNSSRMGTNKAFIEFDGKTLLERAIESKQPHCDHIVISCRRDEADLYASYGTPMEDILSDRGPMGSIYTAFEQYPDHDLLICAVDQVHMDNKAFEAVVNYELDHKTLVAVAQSVTEQPLLSKWSCHNKQGVSDYLSRNRASVLGYLAQIQYTSIQFGDGLLYNLNSPEDLKALNQFVNSNPQ